MSKEDGDRVFHSNNILAPQTKLSIIERSDSDSNFDTQNSNYSI